MIGLDSNILVQFALSDHLKNAATLTAVRDETAAGHRLILTSVAINEFLHVSTDPRRFTPPLTMIEALDWIEEFRSNPFVDSVEANLASVDQSLQWMRQFNLGRKRIIDTHLAAILFTRGVRRLLTSNPDDFTVFANLT